MFIAFRHFSNVDETYLARQIGYHKLISYGIYLLYMVVGSRFVSCQRVNQIWRFALELWMSTELAQENQIYKAEFEVKILKDRSVFHVLVYREIFVHRRDSVILP